MTDQKPLFTRTLNLNNYCDICGKPRSSGNNKLKHVKCAEARKRHYESLHTPIQ